LESGLLDGKSEAFTRPINTKVSVTEKLNYLEWYGTKDVESICASHTTPVSKCIV
jgi:hypothetical protein